ncbi:molybdopterin-dependent oxidoreductase, partial [Amycolatopsis sp. NPDC004378]
MSVPLRFVVGIAVFLLLHRIAPRVWREPDSAKTDTSRRAFLLGGAGVVVGAGAAGLGGQLISSTRDATASREAVGKLVPARTAPTIPADADFAK